MTSRYRRLKAWPRPGRVEFGQLRRLEPFSHSWGFDRGLPIDRHYIAGFLENHSTAPDGSSLVRGRVLEIGKADYAPLLADAGAIERIDILDVAESRNPTATLIGDLANAPHLPSNAFDCIICTQTLLLIYDVHAAVRTLHRILKPGGTLLVTLPGISQICQPEMEVYGDFWRFTTRSTQGLFQDLFNPGDLIVESYGNVLTASAFLYGLATEDLTPVELAHQDADYQLLIGVRATKQTARTTLE